MKSNLVGYISLQTLYLAKLCMKVLLANQIALFFKVQHLKKKAEDPVYLIHVDKHQFFPQVDGTFFGGRGQAFSKSPK